MAEKQEVDLKNKRIGVALCGSFCTFSKTFDAVEELVRLGAEVTPIMSFNAYSTDTRFGSAAELNARLEKICGRPVIHTIADAEPIGPMRMFDVLAVAPCTGNTLAKLAFGITDTPVTMAVKSHIRNSRPVVIAVSTNDALAGAAKAIGLLENYKNYYFVPMRQDDSEKKPFSVVADYTLLKNAVEAALRGVQLQPMIL